MNTELQILPSVGPPRSTASGPAGAKARLLDWASGNDARARAAGWNAGTMAARGVAAIMCGVIVGRMIAPRRKSARSSRPRGLGAHLVGAALVARAAMVIAPHAIRIVQSTSNRRTPH